MQTTELQVELAAQFGHRRHIARIKPQDGMARALQNGIALVIFALLHTVVVGVVVELHDTNDCTGLARQDNEVETLLGELCSIGERMLALVLTLWHIDKRGHCHLGDDSRLRKRFNHALKELQFGRGHDFARPVHHPPLRGTPFAACDRHGNTNQESGNSNADG